MSLSAAARRFVRASGKLDLSVEYITMFDDIIPATLPSGLSYAYACYINGDWPNFPELVIRFPGHHLLDITVFASGNATCFDIETGDGKIEDAPGWYERQVLLGVYRPVLYINAANMKSLELVMAAAGVPRSSYRIWSAHYTNKPHLCSPKTCGYGISQADGTQWTEKALGLSLDRSILVGSFFDPRPAPPAPVPVPSTWQEDMLNALPTLKQGDIDEKGKPPNVRVMQAAIQAQGHANDIEAAYDLKPDGNFGPLTLNALLTVQEHFGLHGSKEYAERVCGPETWPPLITGHA